MLVAGDLGFSSLVLVASLVFPVIALVIRRKWRISVARNEEIKRLLILASEEAARAEFEATVSYGAVSVPRDSFQCAVCYCPTSRKCARCKAVRYCSGKCQIIHWRQGHKEECHAPNTTYHNDDDGSSSLPRLAKQDQHNIYYERNEKLPIEKSSTTSSEPSCSTEVKDVKSNDAKVGLVPDTERTFPICESPGTSFSGFSSSAVGSESSDDASVVESICSNEADVSDGQASGDIGHEILESSLKEVVETKPLSPKFASLVDSVGSFSKLSKLNQSKAYTTDSDNSLASSSSPAQSIGVTSENSIARPGKVCSGFWDRSVKSASTDDARDVSARNSIGADNNKLHDSESSRHYKFSLPGNNAPSLHTKSSKIMSSISDELPASLEKIRPVDRAIVSEDSRINALKVRSSPFRSHERPSCIDNDVPGDSKVSTSGEFKSVSSSSDSDKDLLSVDASNVCKPPSLSSRRSNLIVNETVSTSGPSKSKISATASRASMCSVPNEKFGKVDDTEVNSLLSSQIASSSPSSISGLKSSVWKVVDQLKGPKCGRYSDKGLFPYDQFVKLYTSNKVEMRPCGLINCGNSCYANAVLQCLAFTPPLTTYFVQGLHSKACVNKEWCFTCEFENLLSKVKDGKSPLSPAGILSQLHNIGSQLGNGREEDAHEFLRYAIDTMQSVCLKEAGMSASGSVEEETTLIGLTFGGYLRSKIKCMKCQHKSERQERMMDLTVEIEGDIEKLEDALKRFTGTEILDGDNKYQCTRCKSYEKAKKKLTILEAPNVLTIALKRFQSGKFGKLNKSIRFPEILDLAPYMSGTSDKSPIYRLYGVVVHLDIMNAAFSGHYVCYVKNVQNKWFKIDDSMVTTADLERVLTKGAYILLYARCSPRAPRLLRNNPSKNSGKNTNTAPNSRSMRPSVVQFHPNTIPRDNLANVESFYLKFHRLQRILEEDSSSDNYSFSSSNSDEGSCSTDSTRDSTSTDDLSEYIFGGWNSPWKSMSDSDTSSSSSSSPMYSSHSHLADLDRNASGLTQTSRYQANLRREVDPWDGFPGRSNRMVNSDGKGGEPFWPSSSDTIKQSRKLVSSNSCRETDSGKLGSVNPLNDVKSNVCFRRSASERTD